MFTDPCNYIGPTWIILDNLPASPNLSLSQVIYHNTEINNNINNIKGFNLITYALSLLPCKVTYTQVPGIRTWTSLGVGEYYSAYHVCGLFWHYLLKYLGISEEISCFYMCESISGLYSVPLIMYLSQANTTPS